MSVTNTQQAYELIKERIITTQLRPGALIQEAELMDELKLGRTPIREALKQLESEKLVVISPRRGIFVADVAISDLSHIQEIRVALNQLCARLAVSRATPDDLAQLKRLNQAFHSARQQGDQRVLMALDRQIHQSLVQCAHNKFLADELEWFYDLSMRIWYLYMDQLSVDDMAPEAFSEIIRAFETKDAGRAERALVQHIQHFGDLIKHIL